MAKKKTARKSYSGLGKKEVALMYNVTVKTLTKWTSDFENEIGEIKGRAYTPKQIKTIFEKLGEPMHAF